jgi:hypothetical protein
MTVLRLPYPRLSDLRDSYGDTTRRVGSEEGG